MNIKKLTLSISVISSLALPRAAAADLEVEFIEGAPRDSFILKNVGGCELGAVQFEIDFESSIAGLIFEVSDEGEGVEVSQPFEVTAGAKYLIAQPLVADGDQRAKFDMAGLGTNETFAFTIDVDASLGTRGNTVADSEISGTKFSLHLGGGTYSAVMGIEAQVILTAPNCLT